MEENNTLEENDKNNIIKDGINVKDFFTDEEENQSQQPEIEKETDAAIEENEESLSSPVITT